NGFRLKSPGHTNLLRLHPACSKRARSVDAQLLSAVELVTARDVVEVAELVDSEGVFLRDRVERVALLDGVVDRLGVEESAEVAGADREVNRVAFADTRR